MGKRVIDSISLYNEIGKNIKKYRKNIGITQEQLARKTSYSLSFISNIESNTNQTFSLNALSNIADALDVKVSELIPDNELVRLVNNILKCDKCNCSFEMPVEIARMLYNVQNMSKEIVLTCPKCNKKAIRL